MSFQSSSHFDSTTLLMVRPEIDNTIKNVENGVSNLLEDGSLPYGIDDALLNLEQCAHVLNLVDQPYVGKLTTLIAKIMHKIINDSAQNNIRQSDVEAMSEATNVTKRYLDFLCVREIRAPQFLVETINKLEIALGLPLTKEGVFLSPYLETIQPHVDFIAPTQLPSTQYVSRLYQLSLLKLLKEKETDLDFQALSLCGNYLSAQAAGTPSEQYWSYVHIVLSQLNATIITEPRLRVLIDIENAIRDFLAHPQQFTVTNAALTDIVALTLSQNSQYSHQIREQLNVLDEVMSDDQLQVLSRQLYGPDLQTIQTIVGLLSTQIKELSLKIETSLYHHNAEERDSISASLIEISNILDIINLNDAAKQLREQSQFIQTAQNLDSQQHATQMMNSLLFTTNSLQILERNYTSGRLKLKLNNSQITLEKVEEAQYLLCSEARISLQSVAERIVAYTQNANNAEFETLPELLREASGALLFLESNEGYQNLQKLANLIESSVITGQKTLDAEQIKALATVIASADFHLEQLQNRQPLIASTMQIGTQQLANLTAAVA